MENVVNSIDDDKTFCFKVLRNVSRSFDTAINLLEEPLRTTVCVFYLILRALDTIEDDTTVAVSVKLEALKTFPTCLDQLPSPVGIAEGLRFTCNEHHLQLMENFDKVLRLFGQRTSADQKIIRGVVVEMAGGMAKYLNRSIETIEEYNEYCYYVAGLLGVGLTELFQVNCVIRGVRECDKNIKSLAISSGKFLQKTNILRDIYGDMSPPTERLFYPKEVWSKYVKNARELIDENFLQQAMACLNFLINDAFQHLSDAIEYLSLIQRSTTFRFTAIPQVMAVGTLVKLFSNPAVFSSNVKLATEDSVYILEMVTDMASCLNIMRLHLSKLSSRIDSSNSEFNWILQSLQFVNDYEKKLMKN